MKKLIITAVLIVFGFSANADANTNYAKRVGGYFYTSLSPYGTWIEIGFGTPVWRPTMMKRNWSPYNQGRWIYTNYGWYWDSYEPFGYVVYHYGRWYYDDYYGWIWIPDYEWAPAWVEWRYNDAYIGWAPLSPYASFSISIGIHYTYDYYVPYHHWNYVRYNHFCNDNVYNYYVEPKYKYRVHNKTKMRTNYSYYNGRVRNDGVEYYKISERSGRKIEKRNVVNVSDPRELSNDRDSKNRSREIKTYFANKEDFSRDALKDVKVEKRNRKSSLEFSKVELGRDVREDRKVENTRKLEKKNSDLTINQRDRTEDSRKTISGGNLNRTEDNRKIQSSKDIEKKNSGNEKRNTDQVKRNDEIKTHRSLNDQIKNRIDETLQKREQRKSDNDLFKQKTDRKVEQKKETQRVDQRNDNNSTSRNNEVKRKESSDRNNSKENSRTLEDKKKTRNK